MSEAAVILPMVLALVVTNLRIRDLEKLNAKLEARIEVLEALTRGL